MTDEKQVEETPTTAAAESPDGEDGSSEVQSQAERTIEAQLAEAQAQAAEYLDGWQRARAELANYRKRTERERSEWATALRAEVIQDLLPILDDFDRAMESLPSTAEVQDWVNGIVLIYRKFQTQLREMGVTEIEALGQPFNPEQQEALMERVDPDHESGEVIEVVRKGYLINGRVLRPALVVVAA